jgi:hypothetical protein
MNEPHRDEPTNEPRRWLDEPRHVAWIIWALTGVCGALAGADLFYDKHGHFGFENIVGFHAGFGFVGCVGLVLVAKLLRRVLMRGEDYYD